MTYRCLAVSMIFIVFCPAVRAGENICFEAESAQKIEAPFAVAQPVPRQADNNDIRQPESASGGNYIVVPQGSGNPPKVNTGLASYDFQTAESGEYYLWLRVWWPDECGNSFTVRIDDGKPFTFGQDATYKIWHWVQAPKAVRSLRLEQGKHKLVVCNREDGAALDQLMLSATERYVPVGEQHASSHLCRPEPEEPGDAGPGGN